MGSIKSLSANQQLSKIEKFKTKYNISSERLNIQTWSISTNGNNKIKKNITELNQQQGKGKNKKLYEQEKSQELNNLFFIVEILMIYLHYYFILLVLLLQTYYTKQLCTNIVWNSKQYTVCCQWWKCSSIFKHINGWTY